MACEATDVFPSVFVATTTGCFPQEVHLRPSVRDCGDQSGILSHTVMFSYPNQVFFVLKPKQSIRTAL